MHCGYVKLHRKFKQWEWYKDSNVKILFLELLLTANYTATRYRGFEIPAGSVVTGRNALAERTGLSVQQVRTALDKLKLTSEVTSQQTHDFSIISIVNWKEYQSDNQPSNQPATSQQPASNQPATTSKEGKKGRREERKKITLACRPDDVSKDIWDDFISQRKTKFTKTALSGIINQAVKAGIPTEEAMRESVERGWQSFKSEWYLKNSICSGQQSDEERLKNTGAYKWLQKERAHGRAG